MGGLGERMKEGHASCSGSANQAVPHCSQFRTAMGRFHATGEVLSRNRRRGTDLQLDVRFSKHWCMRARSGLYALAYVRTGDPP